jgi:hypothetical protein
VHTYVKLPATDIAYVLPKGWHVQEDPFNSPTIAGAHSHCLPSGDCGTCWAHLLLWRVSEPWPHPQPKGLQVLNLC